MTLYHTNVRAEIDLALRVVGLALLLTLATPVSIRFGRMEFLHEALADYTTLQAIGALAPTVAGLLFVAITLLPSLTRLGVGVGASAIALAALATSALSPDAWESMLAVTTHGLLRHPYPLFANLVLLGSAGAVATTDASRAAVRTLVGLGWLAAALFYAMPERGYPMIAFLALHALDGFRQDGLAGLAFQGFPALFGLIPALTSVLAIPLWLDRRRRALGLSHLCAWLLPAVIAATSWLAFTRGGGAGEVLLALRAVALLAAATVPLIAAMRAIAGHLVDDHLPTEPSPLARDHLLARAITALPADLETLPEALDALDRAPLLAEHHPLARWLVQRRVAELRRHVELSPPPPGAAVEQLRALVPLTPLHRLPTTRLALAWLRRPLPELSLALTLLALTVTAWAATRQPTKGVAEWNLGPRTPEADHFFGQTLPRYVVARVERDARVERTHTSAVAGYKMRELSQTAARESSALGPDLHQSVTRFSDEVHDLDVSSRQWIDRIDAINLSIRDLDLPYYVDADAWELHTPQGERRFLYLKTYHVLSLRRFSNHAGDLVAAIHLRRLDKLNLRSAVLGLSRDWQPFAMVLLDEIDRYTARLLPGLALDPPRCHPPTSAAPAWLDALERRCGQRLSHTLDALIEQLPEEQRRLYRDAMQHLQRRSQAWASLTEELAEEGEVLLPTEELILSPQTLTQLLHITTPAHTPLVDLIRAENDALATTPDAFEPVVGIVVTATERHEIQHQLDGPGLPVPTTLYDLMGGASDALVTRAARELSGYLAEFILDDIHALLTLAHLLGFVDQLTPTSAEYFAAAVIFQLLSETTILDEDGNTSAHALADAWERASALDTHTRHRRVQTAYQELFSRELETLQTAR